MDVDRNYDTNGQVRFKVTSSKFNHFFDIRKSNDGFNFYEIGVSDGKVAKVIQGRYTSPELALRDLASYIKTLKETRSAARDRKYKKNHDPATLPDNTEQLQ